MYLMPSSRSSSGDQSILQATEHVRLFFRLKTVAIRHGVLEQALADLCTPSLGMANARDPYHDTGKAERPPVAVL